jgi:hypothetical protein
MKAATTIFIVAVLMFASWVLGVYVGRLPTHSPAHVAALLPEAPGVCVMRYPCNTPDDRSMHPNNPKIQSQKGKK